jgi:predicted dehydrogenase
MTNSTKLRAAIIGCGGMGRNHARVLKNTTRFALVAAADRFPQPLEEMRKVADSIQLYSDADEMLSRERPDIVAVSTAVRNHCETTIASLRAGAHVLCEKPLARSLKEADQMIDCAAETNRLLLVHNEYNISPRTLAALQVVRDGGIGQVVAMRGTFKGNFCGGWDIAEGAPHLFALAIQFAGAPQWVCSEIITDDRPATEADIFEGGVLKTVNAGLIVGDRIHAMVGFEHGVVMHAEFLGVKTNPHLLVVGTEGAVLVPYGASEALSYRTANPNDPDIKWEPLEYTYGEYASIEGANPRTVTMGYDHIADWLATKQAGVHPMSALYGRQALEVIHGTYESHFQGGRKITIPLERRDHPLERRVNTQSE